MKELSIDLRWGWDWKSCLVGIPGKIDQMNKATWLINNYNLVNMQRSNYSENIRQLYMDKMNKNLF